MPNNQTPFRPPARGILLDIEGTTSSISFVYDVMFPFIRRELTSYLAKHRQEPSLAAACEKIAHEAGNVEMAKSQTLVQQEVIRLMDGDVKSTGLKHLQGLIWEEGFHSGELQAHLYDDVPPALRTWNEQQRDVRIYSSGSIQAQKLFFGHTVVGNLLPLLRGHYDTTTGPKREAASYTQIAADFNFPANQILFVSDVVAELDAAQAAGLQTVLALRPGNAEVPSNHGHRTLASFAEIE